MQEGIALEEFEIRIGVVLVLLPKRVDMPELYDLATPVRIRRSEVERTLQASAFSFAGPPASSRGPISAILYRPAGLG